jgi:hypothetical protein
VVFDIDDGYLSGPIESIIRVFHRIKAAFIPLGLRMATHKCQLYANDVTNARAVLRKFPDTPISLGAIDGLDTTAAPNGAGYGIMCAGIPLGDDCYLIGHK